jgi:hypothetical protein
MTKSVIVELEIPSRVLPGGIEENHAPRVKLLGFGLTTEMSKFREGLHVFLCFTESKTSLGPSHLLSSR